ncbi:unnamed protein product [Arabidopsis lyrata]|nr:unnamed protein product [Arabidopsis lyrata]
MTTLQRILQIKINTNTIPNRCICVARRRRARLAYFPSQFSILTPSSTPLISRRIRNRVQVEVLESLRPPAPPLTREESFIIFVSAWRVDGVVVKLEEIVAVAKMDAWKDED